MNRNRNNDRFQLIVGVLTALLLTACSAGGNSLDATPENVSPQQVATGLPPFPDTTPSRNPAVIAQATQQGAAAAAISQGAMVSGTDLVLDAATNALEYGMYAFNAGDATLLSIAVELSATAGSDVWVAIANHGPRLWEFHGPYAAAEVVTLDSLDEGIYTNLEGDCQVLVAAFNSASATIAGAEFTTDDTPADVSISGNILGDPGEIPLEGVILTLSPGGATALTDAGGDYSYSAVAAGQYVITPTLSGYTFSPASYNLNLQGLATDVDFYGLPEG